MQEESSPNLLALLSDESKKSTAGRIRARLHLIEQARREGISVADIAAALTADGVEISAKRLSQILYDLQNKRKPKAASTETRMIDSDQAQAVKRQNQRVVDNIASNAWAGTGLGRIIAKKELSL